LATPLPGLSLGVFGEPQAAKVSPPGDWNELFGLLLHGLWNSQPALEDGFPEFVLRQRSEIQ